MTDEKAMRIKGAIRGSVLAIVLILGITALGEYCRDMDRTQQEERQKLMVPHVFSTDPNGNTIMEFMDVKYHLHHYIVKPNGDTVTISPEAER